MVQPFPINKALTQPLLPAPWHSLDEAFSSFADVASNLQLAYASLQEDLVRLREELSAERAARHRSEAMAEVAAVLAHEVRNPLGSLEIFVALLDRAPELSTTSRSHTRHLQAGLRSLGSTVNTVLQFHNPAPPVFSQVDVGVLLDWARDFLSPLAEQSRVRFLVSHTLDGVAMRADRNQLEQVFMNLARNCFQHSAFGNNVTITGKRDALALTMLEITVCDEGTGIAAESLPHIFEANFTTKPGGTGLGLAVVRQIVEQHDGWIQVSSEAGRGTTVTMRFPISEVQP